MDKSAYQKLTDELDRTAVISETFKKSILAHAAMIAQEAYEIGKKESNG